MEPTQYIINIDNNNLINKNSLYLKEIYKDNNVTRYRELSKTNARINDMQHKKVEFLRNYKLNEEILATLRKQSGRDNFSNNMIIEIIHKILDKKPDIVIFGGEGGLINYLTKVLINQKPPQNE